MELGRRVRGWFRLWFGFDDPVDRRTYLRHGAALFALKYGVDVLLVRLTTGRLWMPFDYLNPSVMMTAHRSETPVTLFAAQMLWTLPFLWIGVGMSMRRAIDAGRSPWTCLLFLCPYLNYVLMAVLSALPSAPARETPPRAGASPQTTMRAALEGFAISLIAGGVLIASSTLVFRRYGASLFVLTPFLMGALTACRFNLDRDRGIRDTLVVTGLMLLIASASLVLFAVEGILCVAMALPFAAGLAFIGAMVGASIARSTARPAGGAALMLLALPVLPAIEPRGPAPPREVRTAIVVEAPPESVWTRVVAFSELDEPPAWFFRLGIAYPKRATIDGEGVGAVRRCEFSTGAFVEPITAWEPPRRLAFDVASDPPPMTEWSPYARVAPPHLGTAFHSRRGEFRLVALPGGRTRLEGRTWYALDLAPLPYWSLWSDAIVHAIHARVLAHVKRLAEAG